MSFLSLKRLLKALGYSCEGLCSALKEGPAFQLEVIICAILIPTAFCLRVGIPERILLIASLFLVLIVELLNTAVETLADRISTEIHPLTKKAKDIGSSAVFLSILLACIVWGEVLFTL